MGANDGEDGPTGGEGRRSGCGVATTDSPGRAHDNRGPEGDGGAGTAGTTTGADGEGGGRDETRDDGPRSRILGDANRRTSSYDP